MCKYMCTLQLCMRHACHPTVSACARHAVLQCILYRVCYFHRRVRQASSDPFGQWGDVASQGISQRGVSNAHSLQYCNHAAVGGCTWAWTHVA
jgi:hypothetical protein